MRRTDTIPLTAMWWKFFWRYIVLYFILSFTGGYCIKNYGTRLPIPLWFVLASYGLLLNIFLVFSTMFYCIGHNFKNSPYLLLPTNNRGDFLSRAQLSLQYLLRFIILAFCIGFLLGGILPMILKMSGVNPVTALSYSKYMGNFAVLPASFLAFISLAGFHQSQHSKIMIIRK